jgi:hypothetical protein
MRNDSMISRRATLAGLAAFAAAGGEARAQSSPARPQVDMYRTRGCGCCLAWAEHLRGAGFDVKISELAAKDLDAMKAKAGLKPDQYSCHTAWVGGYAIEGHVPARDILRLLSERPAAAGLTVPGMPIGSPGMENGTAQDAYEVLLFAANGTATVFATYPARS